MQSARETRNYICGYIYIYFCFVCFFFSLFIYSYRTFLASVISEVYRVFTQCIYISMYVCVHKSLLLSRNKGHDDCVLHKISNSSTLYHWLIYIVSINALRLDNYKDVTVFFALVSFVPYVTHSCNKSCLDASRMRWLDGLPSNLLAGHRSDFFFKLFLLSSQRLCLRLQRFFLLLGVLFHDMDWQRCLLLAFFFHSLIRNLHKILFTAKQL